MRKAVLIAGSVGLLVCACTPPSASVPTAPTPVFMTSTLAPTVAPSVTPPPPTTSPPPTPTPVTGITSTQLYVRARPMSSAAQLGLMAPATTLKIIGKDPSGAWYQIAYPQSPEGKGWVAAQYVQAQDVETIPVIGAADGLAASAAVLQQVNVRSGPGTDSDSIGTLNPRDVVPLVGKDSSGNWLQIEYASGPGGRGWISAGFVQASGVDNLPIVAASGQVVEIGTQTGVPPTPTATAAPAADDHDTAQAPAVNMSFSPAGSGALIYSSDLSSPEGDAADWVAFTPYEATVMIRLECTGSGQVAAELLLDGKTVPNWPSPSCGTSNTTMLQPNKPYVLKLSVVNAGGQSAYVRYTLSIQN